MSPSARPRPVAAIAVALLLAAAGIATSEPARAAMQIPKRTDRAVHDYAGVVVQEDQRAIEAIAQEVWQKGKVAIVVVTLRGLEGEPIEDLGIRWGRAWGIGDKETNRGVLLLMSLQERKVRIETGYGAGGYLPDGLIGEILDEEVIPNFRLGNHSLGLRRAVERLADLSAGEYGFELTGRPAERSGRTAARGGGLILLLILLLILVGGGGPSILWWLLLGGRSGQKRGRRGQGPWYWGAGSGPWKPGGGFGGFGGGSGGGFGGFGGGSFGGGGASRGW